MADRLFKKYADVQGLVAKHLGKPGVALAGVLTRVVTGELPAGNLTGAPAETTTTHKFRGFVKTFSHREIDGTVVKVADRKVVILAGTLKGVVPEPNDVVQIEAKTWRIDRILSRDPAEATYTVHAKPR